jgi:transposase
MSTIPLGIDISKATFDVALLSGGKRAKRAQFDNTLSGFEQLSQWLKTHAVSPVHACLEATNIYGHALATYLHHQGHAVSIVNPARVKGYAQSQLSRTKNDAADASLIARFCRDIKPSLWHPAPAAVAKLQSLTRRLEALEQMMTQEKNRLELCDDPELRAEIEAHIKFLEDQAKAVKQRSQQHIEAHDTLAESCRLLTSITGIAHQTAAIVLGEIGSVENFGSAHQLAAFAGLTPREFKSGTSINGATRLCKIGNAHLRKALYFPALSLMRHCPEIQAFRQRLLDKGKQKMAVVGAVMHKLIRVIYGVLTSRQDFDPKKLASQPS